MPVDSGVSPARTAKPDWYEALSSYARPNTRKALWQIFDTFVPYLALWAIIILAIREEYPFWIFFPLILAASALLVRIFILFHDSSHNSFFLSSRANTILGYLAGILTFTPYDDWRRAHGIHHNVVGDLDRRGVGDIWTMTVDEYRAASKWTRLKYRLYRNPFILFGIGPVFMFLLIQRLPTSAAGKRERTSVIITDVAILAIFGAMSATIGLGPFLLIQGAILAIAGAFGVWLFYIQHQFEGVYWARHADWDPLRASVEGSSHYQLPGVLQWISGNIGLHHIHHLRPRIPNYHLQQCFHGVPALQTLREPLTIRQSFRCLSLNLWDEANRKLVSFREVDRLSRRTEPE
ncbi:MAG: fatty acid desaturase [Candidatus Latescibacterota bacterium]